VHLTKIEREAQSTLDFNKEVIILRIMLELFSYDDVRADLQNA
jgi:hypothetical protein